MRFYSLDNFVGQQDQIISPQKLELWFLLENIPYPFQMIKKMFTNNFKHVFDF